MYARVPVCVHLALLLCVCYYIAAAIAVAAATATIVATAASHPPPHLQSPSVHPVPLISSKTRREIWPSAVKPTSIEEKQDPYLNILISEESRCIRRR